MAPNRNRFHAGLKEDCSIVRHLNERKKETHFEIFFSTEIETMRSHRKSIQHSIGRREPAISTESLSPPSPLVRESRTEAHWLSTTAILISLFHTSLGIHRCLPPSNIVWDSYQWQAAYPVIIHAR